MSTVTMYDSAANAWPPGAQYLAAYVDGRYANHEAAVATGAKVVTITVFGCDADVGDVEQGCIWPNSKAAAWARAQLDKGRRPTLYTFMANWGPLTNECLKVGVIASQVDWWVAQWDGVATVPAGAVAKQYYSDDRVDISVALATWAAIGAAGPGYQGGGDVFIKEANGKVYQLIYGGTGSYWRNIPDAQAALLPAAAVVQDDGGWLSLWKVGANP